MATGWASITQGSLEPWISAIIANKFSFLRHDDRSDNRTFFAKNDYNLCRACFREKRRETITITIPFVSPYNEDLASFPFFAITVCYHLGAVSAHLLVNSRYCLLSE
jgi:hypothetical protein